MIAVKYIESEVNNMKKQRQPYRFSKVIWGNIRRYQYLNELSDEQLANVLKLTTRTLYNYDKDPSDLTLKRIQLFIDNSGLEIQDLISS